MTITVTTNKVQYIGDGTQVDYPYTFPIYLDSDLEVYVDDVLQTLTTDYTVSGAGDANGGLVTFEAGSVPPDQSAITIARVIPLTQLLDLTEYDRFPAESIEDALDRLTIMAQQQQETLDRTLQYSITVPSQDPFYVQFGEAAERAGKLWAFDNTGNLVILIDPAEDKAYRWAEEDEDVIVENRGGQDRFSAHHWAIKAQNVVDPPMTTKGDLYGQSDTGPTRVPVGVDDSVLVADSTKTIGLEFRLLPQLLPPLGAGTKLQTLQVNKDENAYELTGQYASTLLTGDQLWQSDESGGEISGTYEPHLKLIAMQLSTPNLAPAHAQCFARFVLRRHDEIDYTFFLRFSRRVGDNGEASGNIAIRVTPYIFTATGDSLNPPAESAATLTFEVPLTAETSLPITFDSLVPADAGAPDQDVLVIFQVDRIEVGNTYNFPIDILTSAVIPV